MPSVEFPISPSDVRVSLNRQTNEPFTGFAPIRLRSPFWEGEMDFPLLDDTKRRQAKSALGKSKGIEPFIIHDPLAKYPLYYDKAIRQSGTTSMVPALTVTAMAKAGTLTVTGTNGDVISACDALSFDYDSQHHYYSVLDTVTVNGTTTVTVEPEPPVDVSSLSLSAKRVDPDLHVLIDQSSDPFGKTGVNKFTPLTIRFVQYWKPGA